MNFGGFTVKTKEFEEKRRLKHEINGNGKKGG